MTYLFSIFGYIYSNILPFVLLLGALVFIHELGHFLVARMCGVRVEVFSLGFGKKIFSFQKGDTLYTISILPLGGYVKMFGEQGSEKVLTEEDKKVSFSHKTVWQRIAIVLAGPLMNFFFAVFIFTMIAQVGEKTRAPEIASVVAESKAAQLGLSEGDKILTADGASVKSYEDFQAALNAKQGANLDVTVQTVSGEQKELKLEVASVANPNIFSLEKTIGQIQGIESYAKNSMVAVLEDSAAYQAGFRTGDKVTEINGLKIQNWSQLEKQLLTAQTDLVVKVERPVFSADATQTNDDANKTNLELNLTAAQIKANPTMAGVGFEGTELYLDQVMKDTPADAAGLLRFDKVVSINDKPITSWEQVTETIKAYDGKEALMFKVIRDGTEVIKKITPKFTEQNTAMGAVDKRYTIGITPYLYFAEPQMTVVQSDSIFQSIGKGYKRSVDISVMTVMSFVKLFQGQASAKNIGGMISIGKVAKDSFEVGLQAFFAMMGILSISLFILNLLPIPVLDGGHLVFYIIEIIKGSPLSLKKMEMAQQVGFFLLLGLMVLAQFNDIVKFLFKS